MDKFMLMEDKELNQWVAVVVEVELGRICSNMELKN
jgi:hypothetical protein